jgi:hypothetical protein
MHRGERLLRNSKGRPGLSAARQGRRARFTGKAGDPFGKLRYIKRGSDVHILPYGVIMPKAM